jgi:hypothetical protein
VDHDVRFSARVQIRAVFPAGFAWCDKGWVRLAASELFVIVGRMPGVLAAMSLSMVCVTVASVSAGGRRPRRPRTTAANSRR